LSRSLLSRRHFLNRAGLGLGAVALASLLHEKLFTAQAKTLPAARALRGLPHFVPKAKRVIYLFQSGAPSQMDLFDPKPSLAARHGEDLPDSIRKGQRLTTMTSGQAKFPVAPSIFKFAQHGQSGMWMSDLLPQMSG